MEFETEKLCFMAKFNYPACELHFRKETCNSTEHLNGLEL